MTASAIYHGFVWHRRLSSPARDFRHRVAFTYLDLDELPSLLGGRFVRRHPGVLRVRRRDLLNGKRGELCELAAQIRVLIAERTGRLAAGGPIRLLTYPRLCGFGFNPVSFYYSFDCEERLDAVVAEVTNTPWGDRHAYVLRPEAEPRTAGCLRGEHLKSLPVSPFQPMERRHELVASVPGETLAVEIVNRISDSARSDFEARLALRRERLSAAGLRRALLRPAGGVRAFALIYSHALALWMRRAPRVPLRPRDREDLR